jgi:uncharacterized protein (DUF1501 family)
VSNGELMSETPNVITRRQFIRQAACAALGTTAITSTIFDLRLINAAAAQGNFSDYKALVCVFLYGGNDSNNLILPSSGADYTAYAAARQNLALAQNTLLAIDPTNDSRDFGLHPSCAGLQSLFQSGKMAALCNVGTLVGPVTRSQYLAGSAAVPPQLFSHNDQQVQWQTSVPDQLSKTGWGGRSADLLASVNTGSQISMCISLSGANTFEVGNLVQQYQVSTGGSIGLTGISNARLQQIKDIIALPHTNLFEKNFAQVTDTAIRNNDLLSAALASVSDPTGFPATSLGNQLKMIAKLIAARNSLSMKRQIFFCSIGGYDTHGEQLNTQAGLLTELSDSLKAFYDSMVTLGIQDKVTAFTASDFSRTFPSNGIGSDHAWGAHQLVVGGAVQGKKLYGTYPALAVNGPDDTSQGRWIPTTAVDEYSATLAKWFGVTDTNLNTVFPNLPRFAHRDLGFLG